MQAWLRGRYVTKLLCVATCLCLLVYVVLQSEVLTSRAQVSTVVPRGGETSTSAMPKKEEIATADEAPKQSEDDLVEDLQANYPNLPIAFWYRHRNRPPEANKTCAKFPNVLDLEFNNRYWQTLRTSDGTFQLYGAYLDLRPKSRLGPAVRILGMLDRIDFKVVTHCQFWFEGEKKPVIVKSAEHKLIWNKKWGNNRQGVYQPYLTACALPQTHKAKVPESVSLVEEPCDNATNNLKVTYRRPQVQKDFAVCVKGLDYMHVDLSVKLVEWIELVRLLGADQIFFYELGVHPNISKVLTHYAHLGDIHVTPITLAGTQPNAPSFQHYYLRKKITNKRQNELIPYNDCLYRHMYEYKYVVLLDIDEVIVPAAGASWKQLMEETVVPKSRAKEKAEPASYNVRNVYFLDDLLHSHGWFDDIPRYMHMLQHVYRTRNFTKPGHYVKCFHDTQKVISLHNHFPLACFGGCTSYSIETGDAQLQHYRSDCVKELTKTCSQWKEDSVLDTTVWKYKEALIGRVTNALRTLGFLSD